LAGAILLDEKIRQSAALVGFGLRVVGNSLLTSRNPKNIDISPAFLEYDSAEKISVCAHANRYLNK
jgi:hypothetical protein